MSVIQAGTWRRPHAGIITDSGAPTYRRARVYVCLRGGRVRGEAGGALGPRIGRSCPVRTVAQVWPIRCDAGRGECRPVTAAAGVTVSQWADCDRAVTGPRRAVTGCDYSETENDPDVSRKWPGDLLRWSRPGRRHRSQTVVVFMGSGRTAGVPDDENTQAGESGDSDASSLHYFCVTD